MAIVEYALCQAHRNNINRYERLLKTYLTDIERDYIQLRLSEAHAALHLLDKKQTSTGPLGAI
jgi:5-bromo-4-chloroindolyl phosphate hydrolysis protein